MSADHLAETAGPADRTTALGDALEIDVSGPWELGPRGGNTEEP